MKKRVQLSGAGAESKTKPKFGGVRPKSHPGGVSFDPPFPTSMNPLEDVL